MKVQVTLGGPLDIRQFDLDSPCFQLEPIFYRPDGNATCLSLEVYNEQDKLLSRYAVTVSGSNGNIRLLSRQSVAPAADWVPGTEIVSTASDLEDEDLAELAAAEAEEEAE